MPHLTKRTVESLCTDGKDVVVWDDELRGFGVRVRAGSGHRYYVVKYRHQGRQRWETLGQHGAITPNQARRLAARTLSAVAEGSDPAAERRALKAAAATMSELAERYLAEHAEQKKRPASVVSDRALLKLRIVPRFGRLRVPDVNREDVERFHREIGKDHPTQANRAIALLSKMFNLAEVWALRPDNSNPCRHVQRFRERARERFLSSAEIAKLANALRNLEDEEKITKAVAGAVRLLLFTGARRGEICGLRWDHIDFERGCLRLPDSKTGAKVISLNAPALQVIAELPRRSPWVFPTEQGDQPIDLSRPWDRIRERAELPAVRIHDLRHSHASVLAAAGVPLLVIGRILGHNVPATTARYAHLADDPVREASEIAGARIAAAMSGRKPASVTHLRKAPRVLGQTPQPAG